MKSYMPKDSLITGKMFPRIEHELELTRENRKKIDEILNGFITINTIRALEYFVDKEDFKDDYITYFLRGFHYFSQAERCNVEYNYKSFLLPDRTLVRISVYVIERMNDAYAHYSACLERLCMKVDRRQFFYDVYTDYFNNGFKPINN